MTPLPPARRPLSPNRRTRAGNVLRGLILLGSGRAEGFNCFDGGREAVLSSLTPPLAFLLVLAVLLLAQAPSIGAVCLLLVLLCGILLPPVVSHLMATLWKRADRWPRYATASTWSIWLALPAYAAAFLVASLLMTFGVGPSSAAMALPGLVAGYMLWLQWFLAWKGLQISGFRAVLTVAVLTLASVVATLLLRPLMPLLTLPAQPG